MTGKTDAVSALALLRTPSAKVIDRYERLLNFASIPLSYDDEDNMDDLLF